jgi:hypothetical protein
VILPQHRKLAKELTTNTHRKLSSKQEGGCPSLREVKITITMKTLTVSLTNTNLWKCPV